MEKLRKKVAALQATRWGASDLQFNNLRSLASDASKFLNSPSPTAEEIARAVPEVEVSNSDYSGDSEKRSEQHSSPDSETYSELEAANVPLHVLDAFIAKFIHTLRVAYEDSSVRIWQYMQTLLYLHLLGYLRKGFKSYPDVNWTSRTVQILLSDSSGSFEMFARIMSPQRLTRLYYGLHNLLQSIEKKNKFSDLPDHEQLLQFKLFMNEVKTEINNEARMQKYLQIMQEVATSYRSDIVPIRRKLENLQELNEFLGSTGNSIKLRRKIFDFFPLPLVQREAHMDSQLLAAGCSMKIITDVVPSISRLLNDKNVNYNFSTAAAVAEGGSSSSAAYESANVVNNSSSSSSSSRGGGGGGGGHNGAMHTSHSYTAGVSSSSGTVAPVNKVRSSSASAAPATPLNRLPDDDKTARLKAFLGVIRQSRVPIDAPIRQFVADIMDLSANHTSGNLSLFIKVKKLDKVVNALPADRTDLRAIVYNLFPIPLTAQLIDTLCPSLPPPPPPPISTPMAFPAPNSVFSSRKNLYTVSSTGISSDNNCLIGASGSDPHSSASSSVDDVSISGNGVASMEDIIFATTVNARGLYDNRETVATVENTTVSVSPSSSSGIIASTAAEESEEGDNESEKMDLTDHISETEGIASNDAVVDSGTKKRKAEDGSNELEKIELTDHISETEGIASNDAVVDSGTKKRKAEEVTDEASSSASTTNASSSLQQQLQQADSSSAPDDEASSSVLATITSSSLQQQLQQADSSSAPDDEASSSALTTIASSSLQQQLQQADSNSAPDDEASSSALTMIASSYCSSAPDDEASSSALTMIASSSLQQQLQQADSSSAPDDEASSSALTTIASSSLQQQLQQADSNSAPEFVDITFVDVTGELMKFKVKTTIPVVRAIRVYCTNSRTKMKQTNFLLNKRALSGSEIVASLDFHDNDGVIFVVPKEVQRESEPGVEQVRSSEEGVLVEAEALDTSSPL